MSVTDDAAVRSPVARVRLPEVYLCDFGWSGRTGSHVKTRQYRSTLLTAGSLQRVCELDGVMMKSSFDVWLDPWSWCTEVSPLPRVVVRVSGSGNANKDVGPRISIGLVQLDCGGSAKFGSSVTDLLAL